MATQASSSPFEAVPPEVFDIILGHLDEPAPSSQKLRYQPTFSVTESSVSRPPIKSLSLTSSGLRNAVLCKLFRHARQLVRAIERGSDGQREGPSLDWPDTLFSQFVSFIRQAGLQGLVQSFTLVIEEDVEKDYQPERNDIDYSKGHTVYESRWLELSELFDGAFRRLTLVVPPFCLGLLTSLAVDKDVRNEFHMPYHILSLERGDEPSARSEGQSYLNRDSAPACTLPILFTTMPWTSLLLNEGSFLRRYTEPSGVHGARHPSITYPLLQLLGLVDPRLASYKRSPILPNLHSLAYVSIYPPVGYITVFLDLVNYLPSLRKFFFQTMPLSDLLPDPMQRLVVDFEKLMMHLRISFHEILYRFLGDQDHAVFYRNGNLKTIECGNPEERRAAGTSETVWEMFVPVETGQTLHEYFRTFGWEFKDGDVHGGMLVRMKKKAAIAHN